MAKDPASDLRTDALRVIGEIGPAAVEAVPHLIALVEGSDAELRREAMGALGEIGPAAAEAIPVLQALLADEAWQSNAANALEKIEGGT